VIALLGNKGSSLKYHTSKSES